MLKSSKVGGFSRSISWRQRIKSNKRQARHRCHILRPELTPVSSPPPHGRLLLGRQENRKPLRTLHPDNLIDLSRLRTLFFDFGASGDAQDAYEQILEWLSGLSRRLEPKREAALRDSQLN